MFQLVEWTVLLAAAFAIATGAFVIATGVSVIFAEVSVTAVEVLVALIVLASLSLSLLWPQDSRS